MAGISKCAGVVVFLALGSLFISATGQAADAVMTSGNGAGNREAPARMEALRAEIGTVSASLSAAASREVELREQLRKRAAQSQSYEETLTDEDSKKLLARIKTLSAELDALRLELKTRMEANDTFKARENALRDLHGQLTETRSAIRRLQQEQSRLAVELKALGEAAKADQVVPEARTEPGATTGGGGQ